MDKESHQDNNTETNKTLQEANNYIYICNNCKKNHKNENYVSMVHKWREYGGYSKYSYPRYFCSIDCLEHFEQEFRCNHCHIVRYDWIEHKKGPDGFTYCNDENELTVGDVPCYNIRFPPLD